MKSSLRFLVACLAPALFGATAHAQTIRFNEIPDPAKQPERYIRFAFNGNLEDLLKQKIEQAKDAGPMKQMLEQMLRDFNLNDLKGLNAGDPAFQKFLDAWKEKQSKQNQWSPDQLKKLMENMQKWTTQEKNPIVDPIDPWQPKVNPIDPINIDPLKPLPDAGNAKEKFAELAEKFMKEAEGSNLGDWLRDSPAWKNAFADLQGNLNAGDWAGKIGDKFGQGGWGDFTNKLRLPEKMAWNWGEGALNGLKNLPKPNLEKLNVNLPQFKGPNWAGPNFGGAPGLPNFGGVPAISSNGIFVVLILIVAVLIGWQLWHWSRKRRPRVALAASVGPCPVDLNAIQTRTELVLAFDYLALLKLGLDARPWNHRVVAEQWAKRLQQCRDAARALADLYEAARYTTGDETLSPAERTQARDSLAQLAAASAV